MTNLRHSSPIIRLRGRSISWFMLISLLCLVVLPLGLSGCGCNGNDGGLGGDIPVVMGTRVYGKVFDASTDRALSDVSITVTGVAGQSQTDAQGRFVFNLPGAGTYDLTVNRAGYTYGQRRATLAANELGAVPDIYIRPEDSAAITVGPEGGSGSNSDDSIRLQVPAGALAAVTSLRATNFRRGRELPTPLPVLSHFTYACELTPNGQTFDQPVTVRMRNTRGFAPGTPIPVGVYNPTTLAWTHESIGRVSADGQWAEFQVNHFSSRDCNLGRMSPTGGGDAGDADNITGLNLRGRRNHWCSTVRGGSQIGVADGHLSVDHAIPSYTSLGRGRTVILRYNSPIPSYPMLGLTYDISRTSVETPDRMKFTVEIAGRRIERFSAPIDGPMSFTYRWNGTDGMDLALPAGIYSYRLTLANEYQTTFATVTSFGQPAEADTGVTADEYVAFESTFAGTIAWDPAAVVSSGQAAWGILGLHTLISSGNTVTIRDGGGSSYGFTLTDGAYQPDRGYYSTLTASGTQWIWEHPDGRRITFDSAGRQVSEADRNGNTTTYGYTDGRLTALTDPVGKVTTLGYEANGQLASITDPAGRITRFNFDAGGDLLRVTNPDETSRQFAYDANHRMTSQTDAGGQTTRYTYNTLSEVTRVDHADGTNVQFATGMSETSTSSAQPSYIDGAGGTYRFGVNEFGTRTAIIDPLGRVTLMSRDRNDRVTHFRRPGGDGWWLDYDARGNLTRMAPNLLSSGRTNGDTAVTYDANLNLPTVVENNILGTWRYIYDGKGNPVQIADANGKVFTYVYNSHGQVTAVTLGGRTVGCTYNADGNLAAVTDAGGGVWTFAYDAYGNPAGLTDPDGRTETRVYNAMNLVTQMVRGGGPAVRLTYVPAKGTWDPETVDPPAVVTQVTDGRGNATTYAYDQGYRLTRMTDAAGNATEFAYDGAGRMVSRTAGAGRRVEYTYNAAGELTRKAFNGAEAATYTYNGTTGLMTRAATPNCRNDFTYDTFGRYDTVTTTFLPSGFSAFVRYTYRTWNYLEQLVTLGAGTSTMDFALEYDSAHGEIPFRQSPGGYLSMDFTFDDSMRRTGWRETYYGAQAAFTFDPDDRRTGAIYRDDADVTQYSVAWTYSPGGRLMQMTDPDGSHGFTYDAAGRLAGATHPTPDNPAENYTYDAAGNRRMAGAEVGFVYDTANRLTEDPTFRYEYDASGNLTRKTNKASSAVTQYAYDPENRLTSVTLPGGLVYIYAYDPFGRLVERAQGTSSARLVYDGEDVLGEFNESGNLTRSYAIGPDLDLVEAVKVGNFAAYTNYLYYRDTNGTVLAMADDHGSVAHAYRYQAFGKPVTPADVRMFAGMLYDGQTGLYITRHRFYDPVMGRFLQRDPVLLRWALSPYSYADNDPVNRRDPLGLDPETDGGVGGAWPNEVEAGRQLVRDQVVNPIVAAGGQLLEPAARGVEILLYPKNRCSAEGFRAIGIMTAVPLLDQVGGPAWDYYFQMKDIIRIARSSCPIQAAVDWYTGQWWSAGRGTTHSFLTMGGHMR